MSELTRKLSYRKDDRAMCPIYECPEKFWESLTTPTVTYPKIFNELFFRLMPWICVQNLKFVASLVPEIIGGTQKICLDGPSKTYRPHLKSVASPVPEIKGVL